MNQPIEWETSLCHSHQIENSVPDANRPLQKNQLIENREADSFCMPIMSLFNASSAAQVYKYSGHYLLFGIFPFFFHRDQTDTGDFQSQRHAAGNIDRRISTNKNTDH